MHLFRTWHYVSSVCAIHKDFVDYIYRSTPLNKQENIPPIRYISRRVTLRDITRRVLDSGLMHHNSEMTFRELAKYGLGAKSMPNPISATGYRETYF